MIKSHMHHDSRIEIGIKGCHSVRKEWGLGHILDSGPWSTRKQINSFYTLKGINTEIPVHS